MSTSSNKYDINPNRLRGQKDIVAHVIELSDYIAQQGTAPRAGFTAIEDGNFVVRNGDIIVSESDDTVVMQIKHGDIPEIRFFPLGANDTHVASLFGYDSDSNPADPNQTIQLYIARESDMEPDGGKVQLQKNLAVFSLQRVGEDEVFIQLDDFGFYFQGFWLNQGQATSLDGVYTGAFTATSGFSTWTHTYFTPYASNIVPVFTSGVNGTTIQWGIENYSASSFIARFSTTAGNKFITFWNPRLNS